MRDYIILYLNGNRLEIRKTESFMTLSQYLRSKQLTGTKVVCEEGDCGACTVLKGDLNSSGEMVYHSINSCITFMYLLDCTHILTIESVESMNGAKNIQQAITEAHASQCGFCTPGIVMSLVDLVEKKDTITEKHIKNYLSGNLCRCTGYDAIIKAGLSIDPKKVIPLSSQFDPNKLKDCFHIHKSESIQINSNSHIFHSPTSIADLIELKRLTSGIINSSATDLGVQINKGFINPKVCISINKITEFNELSLNNNILTIGAKITLTHLQNFVEDIFPELHKLLNIFASPQIKNVATLVGNIANASPIADTIPFLMITNSIIVVEGSNGSRSISINDFYTGYKKMDLASDEIISKVLVTIPKKEEIFKLYKVSKRKDLDISCVTAAFKMKLNQSNQITSLQIAFGGVGPTVLRMHNFESKFINQTFSRELFHKIGIEVSSVIKPMSDVRGSEKFRRILVKNLFIKFYLDATQQVVIS